MTNLLIYIVYSSLNACIIIIAPKFSSVLKLNYKFRNVFGSRKNIAKQKSSGVVEAI